MVTLTAYLASSRSTAPDKTERGRERSKEGERERPRRGKKGTEGRQREERKEGDRGGGRKWRDRERGKEERKEREKEGKMEMKREERERGRRWRCRERERRERKGETGRRGWGVGVYYSRDSKWLRRPVAGTDENQTSSLLHTGFSG